uniref:F-box domain-containing protein n=1 Tax=Panagrellus redivivus TaxID=6233 RepID=A0A7E4VKK9_PANRE
MSNNHLQWHLLREVNQIALEEIRHQNDLYRKLHRGNDLFGSPALPKLAFLCSLFLSGKEPAASVDLVLSQSLFIFGTFFRICGKLCQKEFDNCCQSVHLRNLALRLTRVLEVHAYTDCSNGDESINVTEIPRYFQTLGDHNCIEKLLMERNENLAFDVAVVEACPHLSTLICPPELLDSLLEYAKTPFSKLCAIETTYNVYNWLPVFKKLTKRPELFPTLETLTSSLYRSDWEALSKTVADYSILTIKSYNVMTHNFYPDYCDPIDFSMIASTWLMFPNIETASVTEHVRFEDPDPRTLPEVYKSFKKFNPKVDFTLYYIVDHIYPSTYSKTQVNELETQLRTFGTITLISNSRKYDQIKYSVTTSYPNKTLMLKLTISVDSDDEEAEDSEGKNVKEDSE